MKTGVENITDRLFFSAPPVQRWVNPVFERAKIEVDVLRLDKIHNAIGGNKWMKLRGFLQKAVAENKAGVLTKGGPWSNHVHACAAACYNLDLPFYAWVKGSEKHPTAMLNDVKDWNGAVRFVNRTIFYDEAEAIRFADEKNWQYIPMGGADEIGIREAVDFLEALDLSHYQYAVCAVGTATTFGGLAFTPDNFETVVGIEAGTNDEAVGAKIAGWQQELPHKRCRLLTDYHFGGFARHTPELIAFMNLLYQETGIATDVVYTGKSFFAVQDLAGKQFFKLHTGVLIIHSGGLQGNRSLPEAVLEF